MPETEPQAAAPLGFFGKIVFRLLMSILWIGRRAPDRWLYRAAFAIGSGLYLMLPERRRLVSSNLRRVVDWLVENDQATPRVRRAASDPRSFDHLVRDCFGHWIVTYAEAALAPRYSREELDRRMHPIEPEATTAALSAPEPGTPGPIHMAMHFGSVDLSALYGARVGPLPLTGPMEFLEAPLARAYFERVRNDLDVTIVPLDNAAAALTSALERGEAVGIVADRNIVGRGVLVQLFGAPARLPLGPAMLSMQTGAPLYLEAMERAEPGEWLGHTVALRAERGVKRREATRQLIELEARAMERVIAHAPEQWTTLFFPIWEDEEAA
jgi:lauroyl/myristoyl acyltransferase